MLLFVDGISSEPEITRLDIHKYSQVGVSLEVNGPSQRGARLGGEGLELMSQERQYRSFSWHRDITYGSSRDLTGWQFETF